MPEQQQVATVEMCEQHGHLWALTFPLWESPASAKRREQAATYFKRENDGSFALVLHDGVHGGGRPLDG